MRKFILLSAVSLFFIPFSVVAEPSSGAAVTGSSAEPHINPQDQTVSSGSGILTKLMPGQLQPIADAVTNIGRTLGVSLQKLGEQQIGDGALATTAEAGFHNASNQVYKRGLQEAAGTNIVLKTNSLSEIACAAGTLGGSGGGALSHTYQVMKSEISQRMAVINGEQGSPSANGWVDFQRNLYDTAMGLCRAEGNGGANVNCSGSDNEHLTLATLLSRPNIGSHVDLPGRADDPQQLTYLQDLLYARIPVSLNPDLLEDPDTNIRNIFVESDRLRAEMSIGQSVFSQLLSMRSAPTSGGRAIPFLKQLLEEGDFLSGETIQELLGSGANASLRGQLEALIWGQMNPNFLRQQLITNPDVIPVNIAYNTAITNLLLMEQYKLLESIALATSTNIVVNREQAIENLNTRITKANGG